MVVHFVDERIEVLERVKLAFFTLAPRLAFRTRLNCLVVRGAASLHNEQYYDFYYFIFIIKLMPKWEVNLAPNQQSLSVQRQLQHMVQPFGFSKDITAPSAQAPRRRDLLQNKVYQVATANKSQILMTVFMFWMFGNNISIFILFPIIQTLTTAVGGLLNMQKVFEPYEGMLPSLAKYKLMYLGIQSILLGIVIYKLSVMGLLPVSAADYVDMVPTFKTLIVIARG